MTEQIAARFEIPFVRYLDEAGRLIRPLPDEAQEPGILLALYRAMVRTRRFDAKAVSLQRTGRLGTYPSSLGQEAVSIGAASAMRPDDVLVPSFREHGGQLWHGTTPVELLLYWGGDERGNHFVHAPHDLPNCIPVGSQASHAAGIALAMLLRKEQRAVACVIGDGATSKGDVYEAMNFAGVWNLPVVFLVTNNRWAISVPLAQQTAARTLAQKAIAAGIPGVQVDGNDVIAVRSAVGDALDQARNGKGACVIEAVTYRLGDHTTSDDARRYRDDAEVTVHWREEPIRRLHNYLSGTGLWSKAEEEQLLQLTNAEIDAAAEAYLAVARQEPATMFDHTFAAMPASLRAQKNTALGEAPAPAEPQAAE